MCTYIYAANANWAIRLPDEAAGNFHTARSVKMFQLYNQCAHSHWQHMHTHMHTSLDFHFREELYRHTTWTPRPQKCVPSNRAMKRRGTAKMPSLVKCWFWYTVCSKYRNTHIHFHRSSYLHLKNHYTADTPISAVCVRKLGSGGGFAERKGTDTIETQGHEIDAGKASFWIKNTRKHHFMAMHTIHHLTTREALIALPMDLQMEE